MKLIFRNKTIDHNSIGKLRPIRFHTWSRMKSIIVIIVVYGHSLVMRPKDHKWISVICAIACVLASSGLLRRTLLCNKINDNKKIALSHKFQLINKSWRIKFTRQRVTCIFSIISFSYASHAPGASWLDLHPSIGCTTKTFWKCNSLVAFKVVAQSKAQNCDEFTGKTQAFFVVLRNL